MLEGGYEVSTVNVKAQTDSVTFTPLWSGDYTFTAVAQRVGAADKSSCLLYTSPSPRDS